MHMYSYTISPSVYIYRYIYTTYTYVYMYIHIHVHMDTHMDMIEPQTLIKRFIWVSAKQNAIARPLLCLARWIARSDKIRRRLAQAGSRACWISFRIKLQDDRSSAVAHSAWRPGTAAYLAPFETLLVL